MPPEKRPLKVFLCHAKPDKQKVAELYRYLRRRGIKPWLDEVDLIPGQDWQVEIPKALAGSDVVIVCLTKSSVDREGFVQREIKYALEKALEMPEGRISLIPLRFEECEVPFSLRQYQWVDLFDEAGYARLMKALKLRASQLERSTEMSDAGAPTADPEGPVDEPPGQDQKKPESGQQGIRRKQTRAIAVSLIGILATAIACFLGFRLLGSLLNLPQTPSASATVPPSQSTAGQTLPSTTGSPEPNRPPQDSLPPAEIQDARGISMVLVPLGEFIMGNDTGDEEEKPAHTVYLYHYYIDKYEVTNAAYKKCVDDGRCSLPSQVQDYNNPDYEQHPVVFVNWQDASAYCDWRDGQLPTEAQWEKAARSTDGRTYPWGENIDQAYANYDRYVAGGKTTPVGEYEKGKSMYGSYDMAGNVWEWTADWFDADYYSISPSSAPSGPREGESRVVRGGAFDRSEELVRTYSRTWLYPTDTNSSVGFRCARDVDPHSQ